MTQLAVPIPTPSVHLVERRSRNRVPVAALNGVDALSNLLKASQKLRNVVGILVTQTQLSVLIVFSHGVHKALLRNEETEVVAA